MKSVIWTNTARAAIDDVLRGFGETILVDDEARLFEAVGQADLLVLGHLGVYTAEFARRLRAEAPRLAWLQLTSAGYEGLARHGVGPGVTVTNAGDCWSPTVAEHALALLLAMLRQLPLALAAQATAHWDGDIRERLAAAEDLTLLIVGYGSIGREIARRAKGFGMRTIGMTRSGAATDTDGFAADEMATIGSLHRMLARADAAVLALPLTDETRHLIDHTALVAMRPGALLVNVSRGAIVDSRALDAALRAGHLAGAGLDVTDPEPLPPDDPLWTAPNILLTPHVAGFGSPALGRRLAALVAENATRHRDGLPLRHRVEVPVISAY